MSFFKRVLTNRSVSVYCTKIFMILRSFIPAYVRQEEKDFSVLIPKGHSNVHVRTVMMELVINVMISTSVNRARIHVLRILYVLIFLVSRI